MAKVLHSSFNDERGLRYLFEIYDSTFSGTSTEFTLDSTGFELTYEAEDDRFTGLIPSRVDFSVITDDLAVGNVVQDIRYSDYKRFQVKILLLDLSQTIFWAGNIINDINSEPDLPYPKTFQLSAICGLSALKNIALNENLNYSENVLYSLHNYFFNTLLYELGTAQYWSATDTFLFAETFWHSQQMTSNTYADFLTNTAFYPAAFVTTEDSGLKTWDSVWEILEQICKAFGCRFMQSEGKWWLVQINAYANSTSGHRLQPYGKISIPNSITTASNIALDSRLVRYSGEYDYSTVLKEVVASYDHLNSFNMLDEQFAIWNDYKNASGTWIQGVLRYNTPAAPKIVELGDVTAVSGSSIGCSFSVIGSYKNGSFSPADVAWNSLIGNGIGNKVYFYISLRIKLIGSSNTYYFHEDSISWSTVDSYPNAVFKTIDGTGNNSNPANIEFFTDALPESGTVYIESYCVCRYPSGSGTTYGLPPNILQPTETTVAPDINIYLRPIGDQFVDYLINGEKTTEKIFKAQNKPSGTLVNSPEIYDVGTLKIGTGPIENSKGRIRTRYGNIWDNGTSQWRAYASGDYLDITSLLTREILSTQLRGRAIYRGSLRNLDRVGFNYRNGVIFDNKAWIPLRQTLIANTGAFRGDWVEVLDGLYTPTEIGLLDLSNLESVEATPFSLGSTQTVAGTGVSLTTDNWVVGFTSDAGSSVSTIGSTFSVPLATSGLIVSSSSVLTGFMAVGKSSGNNRYEAGIFVATPIAGSSSLTATLVSVVLADVGGGSYVDTSLFGDDSINHYLNPGDIVFSAFRGVSGVADTIDLNFSINYKTKQ